MLKSGKKGKHQPLAMLWTAVEGGTLYSMLKGKESAAGKKIVSYRVKYPLTFNADSTKIATWGYSKISQFSIEEATN